MRGDPRPIVSKSDKVIVGEYSRPYETHVPMGTPAAGADVKPDRVDVWSFTQNVAATLLLAADQAKRQPKDVYVHGTFQAGAFGNGNATDVPRQAVEISKQLGKPVKVIWDREEDFKLGYLLRRMGQGRAAKASFEKYLELAPRGDYAEEARRLVDSLR